MTDTLREIADPDRRASALLRGLSARMGSNRTAEMEAYLAGFERIEDGLAMLAMRMAETATAARMVPVETKFSGSAATGTVMAETIRTKTSDDPFAIDDLLPVQPVGEVRASATPERVASVEPVGSVAHPVRSKPHPRAVGVDTFDIVESYPGDPADPWLPDGVDKLAQIYEADAGFAAKTVVMGSVDRDPAKAVASESAKPDLIDAAPAPAVSAQPMMPLAGGMVGMVGSAAATTEVDRDWLERRLGDLAHQIEHSFTFSRSDAQFEAIGQRMSAIETEIAALAARPSGGTDATKLAAFDHDLQSIAGEFEAARSELSRLRTIEDQLSALIEHVDEGGIAAAVDKVLEARLGKGGTMSAMATTGSMVGGYTEVEVQQFAMAAAEAAVAKMVAVSPERVGTEGATDAALRVDSMQAMLAGYIQDRRAGDDQNALAIDALQQAMLRVLDRLDEIEALVAQQSNVVIEAHNEAVAQTVPALDDADIRPAFGKREAARDVARDVVREAPVVPAAAAATKVAVDTAMVARADKAKAEPKLPVLPEPVAPAPVAALDERDEAGLDPIARQRMKLQASAQRAAEAQRLKQDEQERNAPVGLSAKMLRMLSGKSRGAKAATPPSAAPKAAGGRGDGRRMLVSGIALAVVLGFGGTMVLTQLSETTQVATSAGGEAGSATVAAAGGGAASDATNATLTRAAVDGAIVDDGKTQLVSTGTAETPLSGIVIGNGAAVPGATSVGSGAANPTPATELPPATVGPLSLRLAAAQGDPSAEFEVATRLAEGKGTDQNFVEASKWYQRAASRGFAQAQYRLATLYERGLGVKADMGRAKSWYQRAAEQGNVKAMHNLAVLAAGRSGGAPDYAAAATWFTQAANHGLADSQYNLAVLTESGTGVQKDPVQAATWFILAARAGDREALRRRDQVKARLDANAWAAAEKQAAEWQPMVPSKLANDARFAGEQWKSRTADAGQSG